ncbi:MAG: RNA polymerase sigma factor [Actinomycetota bacterium]|nr:RNA polymerase sigma factor [Actinomycetota bacterium]
MVESDFDTFFRVEALSQVRRATLLLGSVELAHDVVQEAFVRVYRRWVTLDDPGSYLNRTVPNLCRDHFRRQATARRLLPRISAQAFEATDEVDLLDDVLDRLPYNHRAAIVLHFWVGLSHREIADQLDCSPGSVGPWIHRGHRKMRKALA